MLEKNIYATKKVFTFSEACMYIGVSESMLYKLTANKEIPHYLSLIHIYVKMTQVYAKIINQKKDDAVNLVNGLFE